MVVLAALTACALSGFAAQTATAATCVGSCGTLGANGDVTAPPGSSTYGWISTYGGVSGAGEIAGVGGTNGSSFTTSTFNATSGQTLQYYFNYVSSDGQNQGGFIYEDYTSVQLLNTATNTSTMLFNARSEPTGLTVPGQNLPPIDPGVALTPSNSVMNTGTGTLGSQSDTIYDSGLAYSGLQIGSTPIEDGVPEPASWAIMLLGIGTIGCVLRTARHQDGMALAAA